VPAYTIIVTRADGQLRTTLSDFPNDKTAIAVVRNVVTAEHPSAVLARIVADDVEFLGAWDWDVGGARWTVDE